ncbi:hypothetical protein [Pseudoxanthomonas gei]|uniref:hypothetical protein n=1 Tax=Pseudoxanthomonas gei TaxID=1383030 RepID=UPI001B876D4D|nr:hypothetical protein [Pseudoxanthomonas gei]
MPSTWGNDAGTETSARLLRGPYLQAAYRHGWRHWYRDGQDGPWLEKVAGD